MNDCIEEFILEVWDTIHFSCNVNYFFTSKLSHIRFGGKKHKQSTHWDLIGVVLHTILEMKDKKYLSTYPVTCGTFMYLVR